MVPKSMLRATSPSSRFASMTKMMLATPAQGKFHMESIGYLLKLSDWFMVIYCDALLNSRLKVSETSLFFEVDSNHFLFNIHNGMGDNFSASMWDKEDRQAIQLSSFDDNNEKMVYFTCSMIGMYKIRFYIYHKTFPEVKQYLTNGT